MAFINRDRGLKPGSVWRFHRRRGSTVIINEVIGTRILYTTNKGVRRESDTYGFLRAYSIIPGAGVKN